MFDNLLKTVFGSRVDREIRKLDPDVARINEIWRSYGSLSDAELVAKTAEFKNRLERGQPLDEVLQGADTATASP